MALLLHQPLLPEGSTAAAVGSPLPSRSGRGGEGQQHGDALEAVTSSLAPRAPPPPLRIGGRCGPDRWRDQRLSVLRRGGGSRERGRSCPPCSRHLLTRPALTSSSPLSPPWPGRISGVIVVIADGSETQASTPLSSCGSRHRRSRRQRRVLLRERRGRGATPPLRTRHHHRPLLALPPTPLPFTGATTNPSALALGALPPRI